jgi:hypothetical protein
MDIAIFWLSLLGPLLIGTGLAIWGFTDGSKTLAIWIGFAGCVLLFLAGALQLQSTVLKSQAITPQPEPSDIQKKQSRAYVFSTASELRNFGTSTRIAAVIELKNMGLTPASHLRRFIQVFWSPFPCKSFPEISVGEAEDTLGPSALVDLGPVYLNADLTAKQIALLISGQAAIYVQARVSYMDVFGDKHQMSYRSYFRGNGQPIASGSILTLTRDESGGNDTN